MSDGPGFKIMDNSFRLPDKYEERCPGVVPLPEGVRLIGQVELGRVNMSVEDVLWYGTVFACVFFLFFRS